MAGLSPGYRAIWRVAILHGIATLARKGQDFPLLPNKLLMQPAKPNISSSASGCPGLRLMLATSSRDCDLGEATGRANGASRAGRLCFGGAFPAPVRPRVFLRRQAAVKVRKGRTPRRRRALSSRRTVRVSRSRSRRCGRRVTKRRLRSTTWRGCHLRTHDLVANRSLRCTWDVRPARDKSGSARRRSTSKIS